ncbi:MAG: ABC transporter permease subunit [Acidobacteriota bacterium]|nr:ABC transporter permease subunit [Acidobacteriota bacterium]
MIAFSLRQFRSQGLWGLGALVAVGVVLLVTGPHLAHLYDSSVAACRSAGGVGPACSTNAVTSADRALQIALPAVVLVVPALVGMFWGAPLVGRELETGTFRLAWTQSVSRTRWLATKLASVGAAAAVVALALGLMASWWASPLDKVTQNRFSPSAFALHGFVPGAYALFAFALGATAGILFRRTFPAMAVTLAGFVGARLLVTYDVRPHLLPQTTKTLALSRDVFGIQIDGSGVQIVPQAPDLPNAWVTSTVIVDAHDRAPSQAFIDKACSGLPGVNGNPLPGHLGTGGHHGAFPAPGAVQAAMQQCQSTVAASYHAVVTYQPAGHFWAKQGLESLVFAAAAAGLAAVSFLWVHRRLR